jgi:hypothetical protein
VVPCLVHVAAGLILLPCRAWVPLLLAFANFYPTNKTPKRGIKGMRGTMKMAEQTREPALQRRSQALSHGYQRQCTMPRRGSIPVQVTAVRCLLPLYTFGCSCREAVGRLCCGSYQSPRAMRSRR